MLRSYKNNPEIKTVKANTRRQYQLKILQEILGENVKEEIEKLIAAGVTNEELKVRLGYESTHGIVSLFNRLGIERRPQHGKRGKASKS